MKTRNEMNPDFLWDLSHIFKDDSAWEVACEEAEKAISAVAEAQGTLGESAEAMKKGIGLMCDAEEKVMLCYLYPMLKKSTDAGDPVFQAMESKAMGLIVKLQSAAAFLNPEIVAIPEVRAALGTSSIESKNLLLASIVDSVRAVL